MILDGKKISQEIFENLKEKFSNISINLKRQPCLAIMIIGSNQASETYVNNKITACEKVGANAQKFQYDENIQEKQLISEIKKLNQNNEIDTIIVQLPLPKHINENNVIAAISPLKDVDGLTFENTGKMVQGHPFIVSATPRGIKELLQAYNIQTDGKHIVVIGRSNIVGKPAAMLFVQNCEFGNATVTICHTHTKNLKEVCLLADIIIVAAGQPKLLTADMVKEGAVVVDVGINRIEDKNSIKGYKLCGDSDFENIKEKCSFISPVPGGVGPMTIAALLENMYDIIKMKML